MNENDVIDILIKSISKQFPKNCTCCKKQYKSLKQYIKETDRIGKPVSYDAERDNWLPIKPLGTVAMANCSCGTTLAVSSKGIGIFAMWRLLRWAKKETKKREISPSDLLDEIRTKLGKRVFANKPENP